MDQSWYKHMNMFGQ